ncbi:MAG: hypothetical protein D6692_12540 [Planctomycetota bacterium]|nr:MAG: hypothetical protein D6692_12540 [Planctomycetota bacterium]
MTMRPRTTPARTTPSARNASAPARQAAAAFGLNPAPLDAAPVPAPGDALTTHLDHARVALLTGPSGCGKSRLLAGILQHTHRRTRVVDPALLPLHACAFDAIDAQPRRTLDALAAAGLAEPSLWLLPAGTLSVGERARLALARAIAHARPGDLIVCDEFASNLDRASAESLARTASRWARRAGVTLLAAGAHEDLPALLAPDLLIDARTAQPAAPPAPRTPNLSIEPGTFADYHALSHHHYLGSRPATVRRILRCVRRTPHAEWLAGVLVVSAPTLNASWRRQAWPGRYDRGPKYERARRLNTELACISRVIVEPRSRGLGIATQLVRAHLADPITPATEAVAMMGALSPFFARAGMTEYRLPTPAHDARLRDALAHARVRLTDLPASTTDPFIAHELARWARHARVRIDHPHPLPHLARHAVCRLAARPRAYASTRGDPDEPAQSNE